MSEPLFRKGTIDNCGNVTKPHSNQCVISSAEKQRIATNIDSLISLSLVQWFIDLTLIMRKDVLSP